MIVPNFFILGLTSLRRRGLVYRDSAPNASSAISIAAEAVGIQAPWAAPKFLWAWAWRGHRRALPLLHAWDRAEPNNTCVNLQVLWLKALGGDQAAYDMLPRFTRLIVAKPLQQ